MARYFSISIAKIIKKPLFAKEAFNRKISLFTSKLNTELTKKLCRCYVRIIVLYGSETGTLRKLEQQVFGDFRNVVIEENGEDKMARESN